MNNLMQMNPEPPVQRGRHSRVSTEQKPAILQQWRAGVPVVAFSKQAAIILPLKLLIAPDKFKGTLTAREAASAIARGWRTARPQDSSRLLPMTDGGDGFG